MKKIIIIFLAFVGVVGCTPDEQVKYSDDKAFLGFVSSVYDLKVPINSTNTVNVVLRASNKVSVARTYNVEIVASETNANALTYKVPATFTIPADSYTGNLTVTGTDNNLVDSSIKKLTLKVTGFGANESYDKNTVVVNVVEFCAVDLPVFTGSFSSNTWFNGPNVNDVVAGTAANTLSIVDFFSDSTTAPNFVITYDPANNNRVSFVARYTGVTISQGQIWARMSTNAANVSLVDACTGRISLWIEYYIPGVGSYGDKNEVFVKQ
jgi:hypothetical protein